uniref:R-phycoerythrin gamma chain, chloroplastic n=1 Tax=Timspurckia oligopyrenoides TaxID=708627 RepID=A0A7S0ZID6_9RHOD|mmetsp:Transcript_6348/g.11322  ORF Transcript_6348/g.11322 Transcript_6348/m.11322 type:complete len:301 (+) Transcript_6348:154-1056(+)
MASAAFIGGVGSLGSTLNGAQVASAKYADGAICKSSRNVQRSTVGIVMVSPSPASASMRRMQNKVPKMTGFSTKLVKKSAGKTLDKADEFFARSVTMQYKAYAAPYGTYTPQCTEGSVKGAAFEKRAMALSAAFRSKQKSPGQKAFEKFEMRKMAVIAAAGCDHEEKMFLKYPKLAKAYVLGSAEAMRTCQRYAVPETIAEEYMAAALDKVNKMRGAPNGVYSSSCVEGNAKGQAEQARVAALATAYRSAMKSTSQFEAEKFASSKYARDMFAHGCNHEEKIFNKYPAVAAGMRSVSYGY